MLPTNSSLAKEKGCNPVSSNCVIWQGPDLECIGLCKGDTVSDVIAKLATELCTIVEQFDLEDYDFSCLQIADSQQPQNLQDLIQVLIERICALEGINFTPDSSGTDCPENCVVSIASCFQYINETGDTVTTMPLLDYVTALGNKICDNVNDIIDLQNQVNDLQNQINDTNGEVAIIEANYTPKSSLDYQVSQKTNPESPTEFITDALREVENSLIKSQDALGTSTEMYQSMLKQGTIGEQEKTFGQGLMSSIPGWIVTPSAFAESLGNAWLAIDDLRQAVFYMQENCCSTGCSSLYLNFVASLTVGPGGSFLTVYTNGSTGFTAAWRECNGAGSTVIVKDELGNTTSFKVNLIDLIDNPAGYTFDIGVTPIDVSTDLIVTADTCFINTETDTTCETDYSYTIYSTVDCPTVTLTPATTSVTYQFTSTSGYTYTVNIYNAGSSTPAASQIISNPGLVVLSSINNLTPDTNYEFELTVVNGANQTTVCPKIAFTSLPNNCIPPTSAVANLTI